MRTTHELAFDGNVSSVCVNNALIGAVDTMLMPDGDATLLLQCASKIYPEIVPLVTHMSIPQIKQVLCGSDAHAYVHVDADPNVYWFVPQALLAVWMVTFLLFCVTVRDPLFKAQQWGRITALWWVGLCVMVYASQRNTPTLLTGLDAFYYRDDVTKCAFEMRARAPEIAFRDRFFSLIGDSGDISSVYDRVMHEVVDGKSLHGICGHCGMMLQPSSQSGDNSTMEDELFTIVRNQTLASGRYVMLTMLLPPSLSVEWKHALMERLESMFSHTALAWSSVEQVQRDISRATMDVPLSILSGVAVMLALYHGVYQHGRSSAGALVLVVVVLVALSTAIAITIGVQKTLSVPDSPYNMIIIPIVFGTGVDSVLIMLAARDRGIERWSMKSCPSIVGSQMSTVCSFVVGLFLPVEHFSNFFAFSIIALIISGLVQLTLFPSIIAMTTNRVASPRHCFFYNQQYLRVLVALITIGAWSWSAMTYKPLTLSFELLTQLTSDSVTYRFVQQVTDFFSTTVSPVYLFGKIDDTNWTRVDEIAHGMSSSSILSWYNSFSTSSLDWSTWWSNPINQLLYRDVMYKEYAATVAFPSYTIGAHAREDYAELVSMNELGDKEQQYCVTNYERLGGYTIVSIYEKLWMLMGASAFFATCVGIGLSGVRGLYGAFATVATYVSVMCFMSLLDLHVHMMVISAIVIIPGIIVDYVLHLSYDAETVIAVSFSCFTSTLSFLPYAFFSPVQGISDFATVYIVALLTALLYAVTFVYDGSYHGVESKMITDTVELKCSP